ncbi:hypothetical protein AYI68_g2587 [Smittium mucronatum]|uniref:Uncharacterized protein n=1 Tax=Smittium mucronatum TaxID=133383 RepID=A0A1R0H2A9_9FUNG|nr:hypothetical protein AYI68_g2587 [Smittium mucronatum]
MTTKDSTGFQESTGNLQEKVEASKGRITLRKKSSPEKGNPKNMYIILNSNSHFFQSEFSLDKMCENFSR